MPNQIIIPERSPLEHRRLEIESLLCGEWQNKATNQRWLYSPIQEADRYGQLLLFKASETAAPIKLGYEVMWVQEGLVFLNLLRVSFELMDQYRICFERTNTLKLSLPTSSNESLCEHTILQRRSFACS